MCGIAGLFSSQPLDSQTIIGMTNLVRHRGPDDEGYALFKNGQAPLLLGGEDTPSRVYEATLPYCPKKAAQGSIDGEVLLGHRRLSILDLSAAGHQPMCSSDQRYWVCFNGEIYNYLEIRQELLALGHSFHTNTDTEVIVHAFQEWREECLHRFNGMFAIMIYDIKERRLFAARDRFGVKPLYYWQSPKGFLALASEIKQFTTLPGWSAVANGQRCYDYLVSAMTDHTAETLFAGIRQLRGGECLTYHNGQWSVSRWYHLPSEKFDGSEQQAAEHFRFLLEDSVRIRLRADVPVGFCLSGGLDSSSIVCLAKNLLEKVKSSYQPMVFSACSNEKAFDERHYMEMARHQSNAVAHVTYPDLQELFQHAPQIVWHQDEPFGSASIYAQWKVFELANQQNIKVVLDGQGADEQLAGYFSFFQNQLYEHFRSLRWNQLFSEAQLIRERHGAVVPAGGKILRRYLKACLPASKRHKVPSWIDVERLDVDVGSFQKPSYLSVREASRLQVLTTNLPMLLRYEDRNSMAHSIESRTPFMDYRLVEFTASLPSRYCISEGITKRILRASMKGILPEPIRNRVDKLGFATACEVWVKQHQPRLFIEKVREAVDLSRGILTPSSIQVVQDVVEGRKPYNFLIWRLINFGIWMDRFKVTVR